MNEITASADMRQRVEALQQAMITLPQYEPLTEHVFHGGMYCRKVYRPAGCLIVGKVHKQEHLYFVVFGTVVVTTNEGVQRITGPAMLCSMPGTKRAVLAETDALCMTIHRTDAKTIEEVEELVEDDPASMFGVGNTLKQQPIEVLP